ncbi:hypothetical protein DUI87_33909 [Hirundo rustica rustica]|uniref:Uncharacterized protein n=1 Tax=Hirundo rustica rustica TaxID=333673 RepID=A0A3M0IMX7_HIRRU|nr:hypothetical protein DUI87_33909 [Hirundo rustica rustica]
MGRRGPAAPGSLLLLGTLLVVTGSARGWADTFPEDTVADHVGDTQGRRYYRHLSDDEDLVASGGEGTPGAARMGNGPDGIQHSGGTGYVGATLDAVLIGPGGI